MSISEQDQVGLGHREDVRDDVEYFLEELMVNASSASDRPM